MSLSIEQASRDFIEYKVFRRGSTKSTEITYASAMRLFISAVPVSTVEELTLDVIDSYITELGKQGFKPKTFKNKVCILRSFIRYLYSKDLTDIRPESIDLPKIQEQEANFLNADEQKELVWACQTARERAMILLLISSGLRVSELSELRTDDIFERSIVVRSGKGRKPRVTFITGECETALNMYLKTKERTTYLFTNYMGGKLSRQFIFKTIKEVAARTTIEKKISPHTLRHSFATNLLWRGARVEDVQPLMGHANMSTTRIYMHFTNDYLHERYDEAMAKKQ